METKNLYIIKLTDKSEYKVIGRNVTNAIDNLKWSKTFDDYNSKEANDWQNKINECVESVICKETNIVATY